MSPVCTTSKEFPGLTHKVHRRSFELEKYHMCTPHDSAGTCRHVTYWGVRFFLEGGAVFSTWGVKAVAPETRQRISMCSPPPDTSCPCRLTSFERFVAACSPRSLCRLEACMAFTSPSSAAKGSVPGRSRSGPGVACRKVRRSEGMLLNGSCMPNRAGHARDCSR